MTIVSKSQTSMEVLEEIARRVARLTERLAKQPSLRDPLDARPHIFKALVMANQALSLVEDFVRPNMPEFAPLRIYEAAVGYAEKRRADGGRITARDAVNFVLRFYIDEEERTRGARLRSGVPLDELPVHFLQAMAAAHAAHSAAGTPDAVDDIVRAVDVRLNPPPRKLKKTDEERARSEMANRPQWYAFEAARKMNITAHTSVTAYLKAYSAWKAEVNERKLRGQRRDRATR